MGGYQQLIFVHASTLFSFSKEVYPQQGCWSKIQTSVPNARLLCSEELARKLATARAEKKAQDELLSTTHATGGGPDTGPEGTEAAAEGQEEKPHLVLIVKADTQACPLSLPTFLQQVTEAQQDWEVLL